MILGFFYMILAICYILATFNFCVACKLMRIVMIPSLPSTDGQSAVSWRQICFLFTTVLPSIDGSLTFNWRQLLIICKKYLFFSRVNWLFATRNFFLKSLKSTFARNIRLKSCRKDVENSENYVGNAENHVGELLTLIIKYFKFSYLHF